MLRAKRAQQLAWINEQRDALPPTPSPEGAAHESDVVTKEREETLRLLMEQEREVEHEFAEGRALLGTDMDLLELSFSIPFTTSLRYILSPLPPSNTYSYTILTLPSFPNRTRALGSLSTVLPRSSTILSASTRPPGLRRRAGGRGSRFKILIYHQKTDNQRLRG